MFPGVLGGVFHALECLGMHVARWESRLGLFVCHMFGKMFGRGECLGDAASGLSFGGEGIIGRCFGRGSFGTLGGCTLGGKAMPDVRGRTALPARCFTVVCGTLDRALIRLRLDHVQEMCERTAHMSTSRQPYGIPLARRYNIEVSCYDACRC